MKTITFCLVLALCLAGCASTPKGLTYKETLQTWIGQPEQKLIMRWGAPASEYKSGDQKYLSFIQDGGVVAMPMLGGVQGAMMAKRTCKTTFMIEVGLVSSYSYEGNWCPE